MPSLPSFGELLHSLDCDGSRPSGARQPNYQQTPNFVFPRPPASSPNGQRNTLGVPTLSPSPSLPHISISQHNNQAVSLARRGRSARFQPYISVEQVSGRRNSLSASSDHSIGSLDTECLSLSRKRSGLMNRPLPSKLNLPASEPISTLLRRTSPKSSPCSPVFSLSSRGTTPSVPTPVSLPTLPAFAFPPSSPYYSGHSHSRTSSSGSIGSIASAVSGLSVSTDSSSQHNRGRSTSPKAAKARTTRHRMQMWNGFGPHDYPRE
ncbi:hypothetical protein FRC03_011512 [Tulasnella sp. 419]|nr:hypothetical protein FRC03_011512 [Tulasnella sp. 419]